MSNSRNLADLDIGVGGLLPASNMATGAAVSNIGYTPVNIAGATMTGALTATGFTGPLTGNAATATNVAYSGLTGTVPTWNQSTTGNAATATNVAYSGLTGTVPTWNQNTTGTSAGLSATLAVASGGTGNTTAQAEMNRVAAAVTSGQYLRGNGTNVVMSAIQAADVPTLNQNTTGSAATFTSTTQNSQFNSIGVGTAASGTAGEIRATNNITAYYSDDRFKTNLGNIPDALDKVLTLNGFYYEANELAQSYGYEKKLEVGVSAQQVQAVQPEVVAPAPIDENYLTVRYERLVPLLVEAIKELNAKVDALKLTASGV